LPGQTEKSRPPVDSGLVSTIGHVFVGAAAARYSLPPQHRTRRIVFLILLMFIALAPDLDQSVLPALGIPDSVTLGHRGATHSLLVAVVTSVLVGLLARACGLPFRVVAIGAFLAIGTHSLLDTFSEGPGVTWLWPFNDTRFPVYPILPAAPANEDLFTRKGLYQLVAEIVVFAPFLLYAIYAKRTTMAKGSSAVGGSDPPPA
jgi:inner membrane protein